MGDFKAVTEKFYVRLLSDGGYGSERVVCQVGLEGLQITAVDSGHTLRKYPLNHIARWAAQGTSLMLYTKTPSDVEERTLTLQADETTIRSLLDTLTCCCMQCVASLGAVCPASRPATGWQSCLPPTSNARLVGQVHRQTRSTTKRHKTRYAE